MTMIDRFRIASTALIVCLRLFSSSDSALSLSIQPRSIADEYNEADVVVLAKVESVEILSVRSTNCAYRYKAVILRKFKMGGDSILKKNIIFGRYEGLEAGKEYLLFLKRQENAVKIYDEFQRMNPGPAISSDPKKSIDLISCSGTVPGLVMSSEKIWLMRPSDVPVLGLLPANLPSSIRRTKNDSGTVWFLNKSDLFRYISTFDKR